MYIPKLHKIWLCQNDKGGIYMYPKMANRHGLIAGATGTGKTVTLKVLAESFSEMGVPVFLADIKGDVSGMCLPGEDSEGFRKRLRNKLGLETCRLSGTLLGRLRQERHSRARNRFGNGTGSAQPSAGAE